MMQLFPLSFQEKVIFGLRGLYSRYGYSQYKMSKFEEYDLYARNKDFLISDSVITFMDTNGKLMAMKPDVTLSIVKNSKDDPDGLQKVYYNENVYRTAKGAHCFKEMMQVGLECIGAIDDYCLCEVLTLAAESLRFISRESILEISHLGIVSDLIDAIGIPRAQKNSVLKLIGEKNIHELTGLCQSCGVSPEKIELIRQLLTVSGTPLEVLSRAKALLSGTVDIKPLDGLLSSMKALEGSGLGDMLRIDFSVVDDTHYYNGIVFKGFIRGVPSSVLTGGQYDNLMRRMGRKSGAIGFAVYTDMLERLEEQRNEYDVDAVLLYDEETALDVLRAKAEELTGQGQRVLVRRQKPENIRFKRLLKLRGGEVEILENDA